MKRSDFIHIASNKLAVKKANIVAYQEREKFTAFFTDEPTDNEYHFYGTLSEFEALLFDEPTTDDFRRGCIAALTWMERHNNADRILALLRLKSGGDL